MYILVTMIVLGVVLGLSPLGRKGRNHVQNYLGTRKVSLDDYDEERRNIDKLMR